jgi:hypothetical protein
MVRRASDDAKDSGPGPWIIPKGGHIPILANMRRSFRMSRLASFEGNGRRSKAGCPANQRLQGMLGAVSLQTRLV